MQGDREKKLSLEVSFLMDRDHPGIFESQLGFFDNVVLPMFGPFADAFPKAGPMLAAVETNARLWGQMQRESESSVQVRPN